MFVTSYFNATAKSEITWGRDLTPSELSTLTAKKADMVAAGAQVNVAGPQDGVATNYWATLEQANEWVSFNNTITPPPTSASASSV